MRKIALSGVNGIGKFALVDDEDFDAVNKIKWFAMKDKITLLEKENDNLNEYETRKNIQRS